MSGWKGLPLALPGTLPNIGRMGCNDRPSGRVRIWRRSRAGWRLAREIKKPVRADAVRRVKRGPNDLVEFVPEEGRGEPMLLGSPALLDAWTGPQ